jgi:deazaflavin-dependent oxidoreductase (nitroreductase family)
MALPKQIRTFNKHVLNPVLGRIARSSHGAFAIIRHVGRRSGKTYETTIMVFPAAGGFVLALTYGKDVDWYRNVTAAGCCVILWHQREYAIDRIEPVDANTALPLFPQPERTILRMVGVRDFVRMGEAKP